MERKMNKMSLLLSGRFLASFVPAGTPASTPETIVVAKDTVPVKAAGEVKKKGPVLATYKVLSPVGEPEAELSVISPPVGDLEGKRICMLDNTKEGAALLLAEMKGLLSKRFPRATFADFRKTFGWNEKKGAKEFLDEIANKCDVFIEGTGS